MSTTGTELLRLLGGMAAPQTGAVPAAAPGAAGATDFASLLQQASAGQLSSGRPVTIGKNSGVVLSADQLGRIASAADQALAQGSSKALVLIDGKAVKLDVMTREITGQVDLSGGGMLTDIDSVVGVPPAAGAAAASAAAPGVVPLPNAGPATANPSLLRTLASMVGVSS